MDEAAPNRNLYGFSVAYGIAEVTGALAVILVTIWCGHYRGGFSWLSNPDLQFNWHPLLMTLGMIYLYGNSIMVYRAFRNNRKKNLKLAHMLIHLLVFVIVVIALQAVFDSHNLKNPPIPNLYTLHSWLGLCAVIMFACQWLAAFVTFFYPGMPTVVRMSLMPAHVFFGVFGFVCAVAAAMMGLTEKANWVITNYKDLPPEGLLVNFIGIMLVVFGALVIYVVTEPRFKRQALPEDEVLLTGQLE